MPVLSYAKTSVPPVYFMSALGHAGNQPCGGGSFCFEGAPKVPGLPDDDDGLLTLGVVVVDEEAQKEILLQR